MLGAVSSHAGLIEIKISSFVSGSLNGTPFTEALTITSTGIVTTRQPCMDMGMAIADCTIIFNESLTFDLGGLGTVSAAGPSGYLINNALNLFGVIVVDPGLDPTAPGALNSFAFVNQNPLSDPNVATTDAFLTFDGVSGLAAVTTNLVLTNFFSNAIATTAGTLMFDEIPGTAGVNATFSASLLASAVPEPGTWALLMLGLGAMGLALRRRRVGWHFAPLGQQARYAG
ncbi:MAG: PEP-CTERM sorting domain-containing protein [Pseudomonadota bacterium]